MTWTEMTEYNQSEMPMDLSNTQTLSHCQCAVAVYVCLPTAD